LPRVHVVLGLISHKAVSIRVQIQIHALGIRLGNLA
jgi:hypothetical protein